MSVSVILRMVDVFRSFGVPVSFEPGWETRGNGQSSNYVGGIVHHTATAFSDTRPQILVTGRSDLPGPLCNFAGLASGGVHVVAAHPANHAGASGGPSMGPLPVTRLFNPRVVGLEIVYPGTVPMTDAQYRTAQVFAIAVRRVFGQPHHEWTRGHAETSITGKWDPGWSNGRTIDMNLYRRQAAELEASGGDDMFEATDREYLIQIYNQFAGSRELGHYDGWDSEAGKKSLVDLVRFVVNELAKQRQSEVVDANGIRSTTKATLSQFGMWTDSNAYNANKKADRALSEIAAVKAMVQQLLDKAV